MTWEELVLMHCTFLALKAFSPLTLQLGNNEQHLRSERKLFQARIIDDGFMHSLIVHEDRLTGGFRLLAAVWDGPLRQCPVWTAFGKHCLGNVAFRTLLTLHSNPPVRLCHLDQARQQAQGPAVGHTALRVLPKVPAAEPTPRLNCCF
jgi:hypothetical protein